MGIYLNVGILLAFFSIFDSVLNRKIIKKIMSVVIAIVVLFIGTRLEVGHDYRNYLEHFRLGIKSSVEIGFKLINSIFSFMNFNKYLLTMAFIGITSKYIFLIKYSKKIFLSFFILYCNVLLLKDFGQLKHSIAISGILISFYLFFKKKNHRFYYLVILLTSLVHMSAFILIFYPLIEKKINKLSLKNIIFLIFLVLVLGRLLDLKFILSLIERGVNVQYIKSKVVFLKTSKYIFTQKISVYYISKILFVLLFLKYLWVKNKSQLLNFYMISFIFYLGFATINEFSIRIFEHTIILEAILFPKILEKFKNNKLKQVLLKGFVVIYYLYNVYTLQKLIPYSIYRSWLF